MNTTSIYSTCQAFAPKSSPSKSSTLRSARAPGVDSWAVRSWQYSVTTAPLSGLLVCLNLCLFNPFHRFLGPATSSLCQCFVDSTWPRSKGQKYSSMIQANLLCALSHMQMPLPDEPTRSPWSSLLHVNSFTGNSLRTSNKHQQMLLCQMYMYDMRMYIYIYIYILF